MNKYDVLNYRIDTDTTEWLECDDNTKEKIMEGLFKVDSILTDMNKSKSQTYLRMTFLITNWLDNILDIDNDYTYDDVAEWFWFNDVPSETVKFTMKEIVKSHGKLFEKLDKALNEQRKEDIKYRLYEITAKHLAALAK